MPHSNTPSNIELLPLDESAAEIKNALLTHASLVLVAEPGAGKTTRFPPLLLRSGLIKEGEKVILLEPRRLAARAAAQRIADEQNWGVGDQVGYQVRFENRIGKNTRLEILTEGLLSHRLRENPELTGVGAVILDEFHERSLYTDLSIGLLRELQELSRPDLRIIVMSATIDAERVASFLGNAPIIRVPGRMYPVEVFYGKKPLTLDTGPQWADAVAETILRSARREIAHAGDILVFLPGTREIRHVRERVQRGLSEAGFDCFELHGSLSLDEQDAAIRKSQNLRGKVILATNIAETSLTIDGVGTVIDSGLARVARADELGFTRLNLARISTASAKQRAGRAGRQSAGICHRMWNQIDDASMPEFDTAEIFRSDLADTCLQLLLMGITDPFHFSWFERPLDSSLRSALQQLDLLSIRDPSTGQITERGQRIARFSTGVRLARLVQAASEVGRAQLGAELAALLSEKDLLRHGTDAKRLSQGEESDLLLRLHLAKNNRHEIDRFALQTFHKVTELLTRQAGDNRGSAVSWAKGLNDDELASQLLLLAFPDRVCRRRRSGDRGARMVGGRGVVLAPTSSVESSELFLALNSMEPPAHMAQSRDPMITVASRIEAQWLEKHFPAVLRTEAQVLFNPQSESVEAQNSKFYMDLPLEEPRLAQLKREDAFLPLKAACEEIWSARILKRDDFNELFSRINFLERTGLLESSAETLKVAEDRCLEEACFNETKLSAVLAKPLGEIFQRSLPNSLLKLLNLEAPEFVSVPSGSQIRVFYPPDRAPFLEVRVQEIFGWRQSPRIARGKVSVQLHLLSPGFKPVQVTSDLESFWANGYNEVRKELRLRYPKHSWPEDPLTALPEAKGRHRPS